ncbi:MAG: hypothetical protein ACOWWR_10935, partial [Eubacteriales bacterium]
MKKNDIAFSAAILAYELGCSVHNLKERLLEQFESESSPQEKLKMLSWNMLFDAFSFSMHPDDTPSGI